MKKWMVYVMGVLTGIALSFVVIIIIGTQVNKNAAEVEEVVKEEAGDESEPQLPDGVTLFKEAGDVINEKSFKVMQVIANDAALVHGNDEYNLYLGTLYLLTNTEGKYYYDEEIVKVPKDKEVRQIGVYRYVTRNDMTKTVPIIILKDK